MSSEYAKTGVDVHKKGIEVFQEIIKNMFPEAFCVVFPDPDLPGYGLIHHEDTVGSKPLTHYLQYKETGNSKCFSLLGQDPLAINLNDTDCLDSTTLSFTDTVIINKFRVPKEEFLKKFSYGIKDSLETLRNYGINLNFSGGETSDEPDQVRTITLAGNTVSRVKLDEAITGEKIKPGQLIVSLKSSGRAKYENKENSGLMCNHFMLARHSLIHKYYEITYPEIREPKGKPYTGRFMLDDYLDEVGMTLFEALTSPTRLFSPVTKTIIEKLRPDITGVVNNSAGGQTKILRLGKNIHYIKNRILEPDPLFILIKHESDESWKEMFKGSCMGTGVDYVARNTATAYEIMSIANSFGIDADIIGYTERTTGPNKVTIKSKFGTFQYT